MAPTCERLVLFALFTWFVQAQNQLSLLNFAYDRTNPNRVTITWNQQATTTNVAEILYRRVLPQSNIQAPLEQYDAWVSLAKGSNIRQNFSMAFDKPEFCAEYEFQIIMNSTLRDQIMAKQILATPQLQMSSPTNSPPSLSVNSITTRPDRFVYVDLKLNPQFEFWSAAGAKLRNNQGRLAPLRCRTLFTDTDNAVPSPEILNNGTLVKLDARYALSGCTFLYGYDADVYVGPAVGSPTLIGCDRPFHLPDNQSLQIEVDCKRMTDLPCNSNSAQSGQCYNCAPSNLQTVNVLSVDPQSKQQVPAVRASWTFDQLSPVTFEVRWARAQYARFNSVGQEFEPRREREASSSHTFFPTSGSSEPNQMYTLQVCALYSASCEASSIDWSRQPKYAVQLRSSTESLPQLQQQVQQADPPLFAYYGNGTPSIKVSKAIDSRLIAVLNALYFSFIIRKNVIVSFD